MSLRIAHASLTVTLLVLGLGWAPRVIPAPLPGQAPTGPAGPLQPRELFDQQCLGCHGEQGRGTAKGPALGMNPRVAEQSAEQLAAYIERGNAAAGIDRKSVV